MSVLGGIVSANRAGAQRGIPSWCTAHPQTLAAIFAAYRDDDAPILVEATCNQVNQFGGYTGMNPAAFRTFAEDLARREGVDPARLVLGGDHLGPNPWRSEPAASAMAKARDLVAAYVDAGFAKIHLDASMACADDVNLAEDTIAGRAADLCAIAEGRGRQGLVYVVGTEVPIPGGETHAIDALAVTTPAAVRATWSMHEQAFAERGLSGALERAIGIVVQPGVDFGNDTVFAFDPGKARSLSAALSGMPNLAFEAHSTDYQSEAALSALVAGHFAILKVGPELTFAFRQAVFALAGMEALMRVAEPSGLVDVVAAEMQVDPRDWRSHVASGAREREMMLYGLSDRVRYYWPRPAVQAALQRLCRNIAAARPEPGIVAQALGDLVDPKPAAENLPDRVIRNMVGAVVRKYRAAAGEIGATTGAHGAVLQEREECQ
ncbi:class II D-tagatose-bisphosphate aldolase, non-catalytic subunit [Mesorhizobium sp. ZMM04-5]|uniref:Class II D-tagatose-bisphosphate aldolase, non-catalytic subunit n=1 Tax=Mesorhizobium marinum TaxID=3228790 RepID=A0ABV3R3M9_9HYPH